MRHVTLFVFADGTEMLESLLVLLPIVLGALTVAIAYYSKRVDLLPGVAEIKAKYPLINFALQQAAQMSNGSPYDFLFDTAAAVWSNQGLSPEQAAQHALASVKFFDKQKFLQSDGRFLSDEKIRLGQEIASSLVNSKGVI